MTLKINIHNIFYKAVLQKYANQQAVINELQSSAANETKSTAGDKHETALAMLQIEQAQASKKLDVLQAYLLELNSIDVEKQNNIANIGSLIETETCYFYLSAALGKTILDSKDVFAISILSPLGKLFLGKTKNDVVQFNATKYTIVQVL